MSTLFASTPESFSFWSRTLWLTPNGTTYNCHQLLPPTESKDLSQAAYFKLPLGSSCNVRWGISGSADAVSCWLCHGCYCLLVPPTQGSACHSVYLSRSKNALPNLHRVTWVTNRIVPLGCTNCSVEDRNCLQGLPLNVNQSPVRSNPQYERFDHGFYD